LVESLALKSVNSGGDWQVREYTKHNRKKEENLKINKMLRTDTQGGPDNKSTSLALECLGRTAEKERKHRSMVPEKYWAMQDSKR